MTEKPQADLVTNSQSLPDKEGVTNMLSKLNVNCTVLAGTGLKGFFTFEWDLSRITVEF